MELLPHPALRVIDREAFDHQRELKASAMHLDLDLAASADSSSLAREDDNSGYMFEVSIYALLGLVFAALTLTTLIQSRG